MARPIEATPILRGKSAKKFLEDFNRTNELIKDPVYYAKHRKYLDKCEKLYDEFMSRFKK